MRGIAAGRRRHRRRWVASVAAVAAAVAILSITTVRIVESGDTSSTAATAAATARAPVSVAMEGTSGLGPAGWVYLTGRRSVAVAVDYGVKSGTYDVRVTAPGGAVERLGSMTVEAGRGSWTGRSDAPITKGSTIALVDAAGTEMCSGTVST